MSKWKIILLRGLGVGAGFAVALCIIGGSWLWYKSKPKTPLPWNKKAIVAEYDFAEPEGDKDNLAFRYILQNNTDSDYRINSDASMDITGRLKREKGFSPFSGGFVTIEYPVFVPAKSRVWVSVHIPYPYPTKEKANPNDDERKQYRAEVAKYITKELGNLDGFALFDATNRYEIDFPNGWEQSATESSADKPASSNSSK